MYKETPCLRTVTLLPSLIPSRVPVSIVGSTKHHLSENDTDVHRKHFKSLYTLRTMSTRNRKPTTTTEAIKDEVIELKDKVKDALTVAWDDLPAWQQDNHYILTGYRPASNSFQKSFSSLGYLHNESVNIYSHLIGGLLFTIIGVVLYSSLVPRYETATKGDILSFGCFFAGAALCLGMSGTYHTISNHSQIVARFGNKLDYVGIVFLIAGSFVPSIYYGFYCHPHLQELYWTMVSIVPHRYLKTC
jgi:adiponectin receptor